jgi:hypothetical protein
MACSSQSWQAEAAGSPYENLRANGWSCGASVTATSSKQQRLVFHEAFLFL